MTIHSGQITQMIQGVSQQHPKDRAEGQVTEQCNCISDIVAGLRRRPAIQVLGEMTGIDPAFVLDETTAIYSYSRGDGSEEYIFMIDQNGLVEIFNAFTGDNCTVNGVSGTKQAYITNADAADKLRFHTIADTTFICNQDAKPEMDALTVTDSLDNECIVYCVKANYGHLYEIIIDDTTVAKCRVAATVNPGSNVDKSLTISTRDICTYLFDGTDNTGGLLSGRIGSDPYNLALIDTTLSTDTFTVTQEDDVIYILKLTDSSAFKVVVSDGNHNNDLKAIQHTTPAFEELPKYAPNEYKIEIEGTGDEHFDNYWVKWEPDTVTAGVNISGGPGLWRECIGPDIAENFDATTMPHQIKRTGPNVFELFELDWVARAAGDDDTNPTPSFIGTGLTTDPSILDIGTFQNRTYFLTGENVVMSRAFDNEALFAASVAAPADDDPIDSASSDNKVTDLLHAVIFDGSLVVFSNNAQFIHPRDIPVTPATFAVSSNTQFNVSPKVTPVVTGTNIMFPTDFGNFTNVWEYNLNTQTGHPKCESTTKHLPRYLVGNPRQMLANTTTDYVFMTTDDDPTKIYVQQFYAKDEKKEQLSWHKWNVSNADTIVSITLLNQRLFLVVERNSTVYLEYIDLSLPLTDNSNFELYVDHFYSDLAEREDNTFNLVTYNAKLEILEPAITTFIQGVYSMNEGFPLFDYHIDSGYVYFDAPLQNSTHTATAGQTDFVHTVGFINGSVIKNDVLLSAPADYIYTSNVVTLTTPASLDDVIEIDTMNTHIIQGYPFTSHGTLTNPYVKDSNNRPYTKRTIIDEVSINVQKTAWLDLTVVHNAGEDFTHTFNGQVLNNWQYKIGVASELDADIYLPVRDYRELVELQFSSDHHLGFALMSMDWICRMESRGRRSN